MYTLSTKKYFSRILVVCFVMNFLMASALFAQEVTPVMEENLEEVEINEKVEVSEQALLEAQEEMKRAEQEVERAQEEVKRAQEEAKKALEKIWPIDKEKAKRIQKETQKAIKSVGINLFHTEGPADNTLIIPSEEIESDEILQMIEDVSIMSRILENRLKESNMIPPSSRFSQWNPFARGYEGTQGIYLQDYGVLFLMNVDFPLQPPVKPKDEKQEEGKDPVWEQTRRELYSGKDSNNFMFQDYGREQQAEYDADKVEELKTKLIKELKYTSNIRNLSKDDWIIVTVQGKNGVNIEEIHIEKVHDSHSSAVGVGMGQGYGMTMMSTQPGHGQSSGISLSQTGTTLPDIQKSVVISSNQKPPVASSVLTIRVKKSEVDDFSEGRISYDQFKEKVRIFMH